MIHVTDPSENYYPVYSIENIPKNDRWGCWAQFGLTPNIWVARMLAFDNWMRHSKTHKTRVRVL